MAIVIPNKKHHDYADKMGPLLSSHAATLKGPFSDTFVVMDKTFLLLSSGMDDPKLTKNEKEWDVFHFLFTRGMKTFRSITNLLETGFEQDAIALVRNLIETVLTAKYIAAEETASRCERFRDFSAIEKYRNMSGYRDANFKDFKQQFPDKEVVARTQEKEAYEAKYKVKYHPGITWSNLNPFQMANSSGVNMQHDYLQGFSTYSMLTHASYKGRDSYKNHLNGQVAINWAPTFNQTTMVGLMASGYIQILTQACIEVMGIPGLGDLITEIQCNIAARMQTAGYNAGSLQVQVPKNSWGILRRDSVTGNIVN
jgi:hypothetical protein